jgi:hypothetical protein
MERPRDPQGVRVGKIAAVAPDGRPLVVFEGAAGPTIARVAASGGPPGAAAACIGAPIILVFENGDPDLPIIVGFVRDQLAGQEARDGKTEAPGAPAEPFVLNGKTLVFEGQEEIVLRCGLGSLTIRANGHVIVKGTRLMSKASESNKIRGATVLIN